MYILRGWFFFENSSENVLLKNETRNEHFWERFTRIKEAKIDVKKDVPELKGEGRRLIR